MDDLWEAQRGFSCPLVGSWHFQGGHELLALSRLSWRSAFPQVVTHLGGAESISRVAILNALDPGLLGSCWVQPYIL